MSRLALLQRLAEARVVAILRGVDPARVTKVAEVLVENGITALEITMNSRSALEQIRQAAEVLGGRGIVGAGTVLDEAAATSAILAGAEFIIAPNLNERVIRTAHRYGKVAIPGAMTPTEVAAAAEAGADIVKLFPAGSLGPRYIKEIKAPLEHVMLMATGGVSAENAREFYKHGADLLGVGSALVSNQLVNEERWTELAERARALVEASR
jgi:2-dehydro-3-deoxyphosphogluconate aldolase/(4S)-4-hydroxy-2-oxoglutarate aldolase